MSSSTYLFDSVDQLVAHIAKLSKNLTPLKLQKSLYLLYAFYGATYGSIGNDTETDMSLNYPKRLVNVKFEAWQYGPVVREVYTKHKNDGYKNCEDTFKAISNEEKDAVKFIDELFMQIDEISDFGLVDRTHQDDSWKDAYATGSKTAPIDNEKLVKEYLEKYVKA
ncbi:Panacea domain-containing protein [Carnobacterium maltaromaticum]|uniref:Panacea domain-containing protein n=1 Tax=Carnobacterium maltaromaticum TaxID=2751 RepID=UPI0012F96679|nr:type II toxin-antitoxin system antitoxin SocA domain-containing protein [Carnobacterium maltaromaticum]